MTKHTKIPSATFYTDDEAKFSGPFGAGQWIAGFKRHIPSGNRSYDPSEKTWSIFGDAYWCELALGLFLEEFPHARVVRPNVAAPQSRAITSLDADFALLHLQPTAPPYAVQVMYREEAKRAHPDRGGKHEVMLALNASYERLQKAGCA